MAAQNITRWKLFFLTNCKASVYYFLASSLLWVSLRPGGDRQGGLACCSPWGHKELDTTERLNWTEGHSGSPPLYVPCFIPLGALETYHLSPGAKCHKMVPWCGFIFIHCSEHPHTFQSRSSHPSILGKLFKNIVLLTYSWAASSLMHGLFSSCGKQGLLPNSCMWASHGRGFSHCRATALGSVASVAAARGPSSCGSWA